MMKTLKPSLIIFVLFAITSSFSQTRNVQRIDLNEKANLYLKNVPQALLEANCQGLLNAYYPHQPKIKVEFSALSNRFQIQLPEYSTSGYFIENCCNNQLCNLSEANLERFKTYIEVVEDNLKTPNGNKRSVIYVRLIFEDEYGFEKGPLFYFNEIEKANVSFINPKNQLLISLAHIIGNHLYTDFTYNKNGQVLDSGNSFIHKEEIQIKKIDLWNN